MHLTQFIVENRTPILAEWEEFARTCAPASTQMGIAALRDHADGILSMIVADLQTAQDAAEQSEKSKGRAADHSAGETAAEEHGAGRAESGFTVTQMVAEYRALRASVIRLWTESRGGELAPGDIEELTRFNEAIDQSLAESVVRYSEQLERAQEISLAIMGHDLREGLAGIRGSATALLEMQHLEARAVTLASHIAETADRSTRAVGILLDFTRSRLGEGIPIDRADASLGTLVYDVATKVAAAHPERRFSVKADREERGEWDVERISQALTNLLENAVQHGTEGTPITVHVSGGKHDVLISVHNRGAPIPRDRLDTMFDLCRPASLERTSCEGPKQGMGLGLYIADRIARAHGGNITAKTSQVHGNTFTMCLPRQAPPDRRKAER